MGSDSGDAFQGKDWLTLANAITALRLPLAALCAFAVLVGRSTPALVYFALAVGSDLIDGRVARKRTESAERTAPRPKEVRGVWSDMTKMEEQRRLQKATTGSG